MERVLKVNRDLNISITWLEGWLVPILLNVLTLLRNQILSDFAEYAHVS